ncbi:MAG: Metal-dependent hydrolase involved in phosphonate metabolism [Candidatus Carbobacillus altaicus]|uniref:Metal-dependent hydrolase involved in phosphonate metabolism n=1 Tax=Candidatus Carbonibacillus altaicus TaxID=2163959 RepID=A0A2R6Y2D0_9BACL|nr:MAG: Metal-dependent hydrolase involved in phosphonate metabolism [Candidatus Carbobacillus altaicus]
MVRITNGMIITEERLLTGHDLYICDGRIACIIPSDESFNCNVHGYALCPEQKDFQTIDAGGKWIMPGLIDVHSDFIEQMLAPRPGVLIDPLLSLRFAEQTLISYGITTIYHSLAIFESGLLARPARTVENVWKMIEAIHTYTSRPTLIRHKVHLRLEIDHVDVIPKLLQTMDQGQIDLLSFMDHTPGQGQYRNLEAYVKLVQSYGRASREAIEHHLQTQHTKERLSLKSLSELARYATQKNIPLASHDDDTLDKIALSHSFGAVISEFPMTLDVAQKARELGLYTLFGAPNALVGRSHNGNLSVREAACHRLVDILCSDYYPPALLTALFVLHAHCGLPLNEVVKWATLNPARALSLHETLGSIAPGKWADLIIVEQSTTGPIVTHAFVGGALIHVQSYKQH